VGRRLMMLRAMISRSMIILLVTGDARHQHSLKPAEYLPMKVIRCGCRAAHHLVSAKTCDARPSL
jgi:hypothetical protein